MPHRKKKRLLASRQELFKRNAGIDLKTVTAHQELEQDLRKLGVEIKPSFNLEPPLGRNRTVLYSRNC